MLASQVAKGPSCVVSWALRIMNWLGCLCFILRLIVHLPLCPSCSCIFLSSCLLVWYQFTFDSCCLGLNLWLTFTVVSIAIWLIQLSLCDNITFLLSCAWFQSIGIENKFVMVFLNYRWVLLASKDILGVVNICCSQLWCWLDDAWNLLSWFLFGNCGCTYVCLQMLDFQLIFWWSSWDCSITALERCARSGSWTRLGALSW